MTTQKLPSLDGAIPKLLGPENLAQWSTSLQGALTLHNIAKYITTTVEEPQEEDEKGKWEEERAMVNFLLCGSLTEPDVEQILLNNGWAMDEENPKVTYDIAMSAISGLSIASLYKLHTELMEIKCEDYLSTADYQTAGQNIRTRILQLRKVPLVTEETFLICILGGLQRVHAANYQHWKREMVEGRLTWQKLMKDLSLIATDEKITPSLLNFKKRPAGKENDEENNYSNKRGTCSIYGWWLRGTKERSPGLGVIRGDEFFVDLQDLNW